jgi:hypothetical protein
VEEDISRPWLRSACVECERTAEWMGMSH